MKTIRANTVRGKKLLESAGRNIGYRLNDVYTSFSTAKYNAYMENYKKFCDTPDATGFHICSANSNTFTLSWQVPTGVWYITYANDYFIEF